MGVAGWLDDRQRRHSWAALPLAVAYKMVDDQASYLAALITYYGFVSLFPLLLLLVTILGFALSDNPALQQSVLHSALRDFPVIGDQIGENVHSLHGSTAGLTIGIAGSMYGALQVGVAAQNAMNKIWAVPRARRPGLPGLYGRSLAMLGVLGLAVAMTTVLAAVSTAAGSYGIAPVDIALRAAAIVVSVAVNSGLVLLIYRVLTAETSPVRQLLPGAMTAGLLWQILQSVGTYLVTHQLRGATATYGLFGIVLGLLSWLYLAALILVLGAEINVVSARVLYPRSLLAPDPDNRSITDADREAYASYARTERQKNYQTVETDFDPATETSGERPERPSPSRSS